MRRRKFIQHTFNYSLMSGLPFPDLMIPPILRAIPSTGEKLPIVGLGTWRVFDIGKDSSAFQVRQEILNKMIQYQGQIIDTSPMYRTSQEVVGEIISRSKNRNDFFIANKVWTSGKEAGINQINESFIKMKTSVIDLMQVHNLVDVKTHLKTLRSLKEEGKIRYIGITHYLASAYSSMMDIMETEKLDFVHFNYNIGSREAEKKLLPMAKDLGLAVIINRPFEEGQLFNQVINKKLPAWCNEMGINSWSQYFLKFVLSHPAVTFTIPGTSNPLHLIENLKTATGVMPDGNQRSKMISEFMA
ncbi:MAG: aldo/keto reductase [Saprospiraceae bacterium]